MSGKQSISGEVQLNCSAHRFLEMFIGKQEHIPNICSDKVPAIVAHHDDWITVGTTRRWDYVHEGESRYLTEKIESVDDENNTIVFSTVDGDIMKLYYKSLVSIIVATPIPKAGDSDSDSDSCSMKWTIEYEKLEESAPEPQFELDFVLSLAKTLGDHLADSHV